MAIRFEDYLAKLPEEERRAVEQRGAELIEEEATLRQLRKAREQSQEELARTLGVKQAAISKLERRADMYVSTLRGLIEAMGGTLEIVARFPGHPPVRLSQFEALEGDDATKG